MERRFFELQACSGYTRLNNGWALLANPESLKPVMNKIPQGRFEGRGGQEKLLGLN